MKMRAKYHRAYTLIEVLVAGGILVMGIAAAASLALTMVAQEKANTRIERALNMQEQAGRLYQLGISHDVITGQLLPYRASEMTLTFQNEATNNVGEVATGLATMETIECELIVLPSNGDPRTNVVTLFRPTIR